MAAIAGYDIEFCAENLYGHFGSEYFKRVVGILGHVKVCLTVKGDLTALFHAEISVKLQSAVAVAQYLSEDTGDNACTDDDMLRRIKKRIDSRIDTDQLKARQIRRYRIALTAASILLPIFIIASAYLYFSGRDIPDGL